MTDPALLVGPSTGDDAAVYRLTDELALVQTVDFFPPIVDDPFAYGEIAAANAISDVYAMGGTPMLALNVAAFPVGLPVEVLGEVMRGAASKAAEAGVIVVGGHTVDDQEPKFGMAVTGVVEPGREVTNAGAMPGDTLVLTKPIGTGVITTAAKQDRAAPEVLAGAVESMVLLNRDASHAMVEVGANACVDVTGFGLLGHLLEITRASGVSAEISLGAVPVMEGVHDLLRQGIAPGGTRRNLASADRERGLGPGPGRERPAPAVRRPDLGGPPHQRRRWQDEQAGRGAGGARLRHSRGRGPGAGRGSGERSSDSRHAVAVPPQDCYGEAVPDPHLIWMYGDGGLPHGSWTLTPPGMDTGFRRYDGGGECWRP